MLCRLLDQHRLVLARVLTGVNSLLVHHLVLPLRVVELVQGGDAAGAGASWIRRSVGLSWRLTQIRWGLWVWADVHVYV